MTLTRVAMIKLYIKYFMFECFKNIIKVHIFGALLEFQRYKRA